MQKNFAHHTTIGVMGFCLIGISKTFFAFGAFQERVFFEVV